MFDVPRTARGRFTRLKSLSLSALCDFAVHVLMLCFSVASPERRSRPQHSHSFWGIFATLGKTQTHYGTNCESILDPGLAGLLYTIIVIITLTKGHTLISMAPLIKLISHKQLWILLKTDSTAKKKNRKITLKSCTNCYNLLCARTVYMISQRKCVTLMHNVEIFPDVVAC